MTQQKTLRTQMSLFKVPPFLSRPNATSSDLLMKVLVKPGAKKNNVTSSAGELEEISELGVQIAAPPREGEANVEVIEFIADILDLKRRQVSLHSGQKSRNKTLLIEFDDEKRTEENFVKNVKHVLLKLKEICTS